MTHDLSLWLTVLGTLCWGVCFWWMHRISREQTRLMDQLRDQGKRIERLSRIEHDLLKEVHPQVGAIMLGMDEMKATAKENSDEMIAAVRENTDAMERS